MDKLQEMNLKSISEQIQKKKSSVPYIANNSQIKYSVTDMDHFPYTRYFRGEYLSDLPIICGRDAGWRPRYDNCYKNPQPISDPASVIKINHCFSGPCTTIYPCNKETLNTLSEQHRSSIELNNACIMSYR